MSKSKCPNCGQFKFKKSLSPMGCGLLLIFGTPILAMMTQGGSEFYGGSTTFSSLFGIVVISVIIGLIIVIINIISPSKTVSYECENCSFEQTYKK
jgi:uncharacterized membrane protein